MSIALDRLPVEDFEALVGQRLPAQYAEGTVELVLESVWRSPYPTGREIPGFSLFLLGPAEPRLAQGLVRIAHPVHGGLELFMTPVGRDAAGMRYEIVFN